MSEQTYLRKPWTHIGRQHQAWIFGLWVFLASEVLLFAGLFAGYSVYRYLWSETFLKVARETDVIYGTVNTAILMTSSLTIAVASRAADIRRTQLAWILFVITFGLGFIFLIVKGFEYHADLAKHLLPGPDFALRDKGAQLFFSFYWMMTGVHAIHVTAGLIAILRLIVMGRHNNEWLAASATHETTALYWHLVDVIWIVLYPLLYLAGRSHG